MWALGLAINFAFSFMAALGLNLQKRSIELHKGSRKPLHRQPLWVFGCCTMTCGSVFDFVAFGLAPMSLLAPLAALTLVWNMLIARWLHAEVVDRANIIATGVIFAAVYLLWMVYKTFFGPLTNEANREMKDLNGREIGILVPMAALMLLLGFAPAPFLALSERGVESILQTVEAKRLAVEAASADEVVAVEIVWPEEIATAPAVAPAE